MVTYLYDYDYQGLLPTFTNECLPKMSHCHYYRKITETLIHVINKLFAEIKAALNRLFHYCLKCLIFPVSDSGPAFVWRYEQQYIDCVSHIDYFPFVLTVS